MLICGLGGSGIGGSIVSDIFSSTSNITYNGPLNMCLGDTILLEGINTTGVSYQWLDNGIPIDNANSVNHNISESGNYSLQLTDSLSQCVSNSTSFKVSLIETSVPSASSILSLV